MSLRGFGILGRVRGAIKSIGLVYPALFKLRAKIHVAYSGRQVHSTLQQLLKSRQVYIGTQIHDRVYLRTASRHVAGDVLGELTITLDQYFQQDKRSNH